MLREYNAAVEFVDRHIEEGRADKTAYVDPARNLTYGELSDAVARIGPMLARLGVEPEDRIALVLLDTVDFPILFWGAMRAGVVPVLLNTRLTGDQYRYTLDDSRAKVAFVSSALLPVVEEASIGIPTLREIVVVGGHLDAWDLGQGAHDLSDPTEGKKHSAAEWFWRLSEKKPGSKMPGYKDKLSEEQRWQVIAYLRALTQAGN